MKAKINDAISESLGLAPIPPKEVVPAEDAKLTTVLENDAAIEDDLVTSRRNLPELSDTTNAIIDDLSELALDTENPKLFESLALIKASTEINEKLMGISKTRKETHKLTAGRGGSNPQQTNQPTQQINVQSAVFIGSTKDITGLIEQQKKEETKMTKQEREPIDVSVTPDNNN